MTRARRSSVAGFTLIEIIVALGLLTVIAISLVGTSRISSASVRRATLELQASQLILGEVERLRTMPIASLADGSSTLPLGSSAWTVTDSGSYLRVELVVQTNEIAGSSIVDTLFVYRPR